MMKDTLGKSGFLRLVCTLVFLATSVPGFSSGVVVELDPSKGMRHVVVQGGEIDWLYESGGSFAVAKGITIDVATPADSPCNNDPTTGVCNVKGGATPQDYLYHFCSDFNAATLADCTHAKKKYYLGHFRVRVAQSVSGEEGNVPSGPQRLLLRPDGEVRHLLKRHDKIDWYQFNGTDTEVDFTVATPCERGLTVDVSECVISGQATAGVYPYRCSNDQCADPTIHVSGEGGRLRNLLNEILAFGSIGISGIAIIATVLGGILTLAVRGKRLRSS